MMVKWTAQKTAIRMTAPLSRRAESADPAGRGRLFNESPWRRYPTLERSAFGLNRHLGLDPGSTFFNLLKARRKVDAGSSPG
jgi:hypothetical protein